MSLPRRRRRAPAHAPHRSASRAEPVDVDIVRLGAQGDGGADTAAGPLHVPLTVPGDRVRVRPLPRHGQSRTAELVELLQPGPGRATPPCPHFGRCGGCTLQHLDEATYTAWKMSRLTAALQRAGFDGFQPAPLVRTPPAVRRRATFAAVRTGATVFLGFNARRGSEVVDIPDCRVLAPLLRDMLPELRQMLVGVLPPGGRADLAVTLLDGGLDVVLEAPQPPDLRVRERLASAAERLDLARLSWRARQDAVAEPVVRRRPTTARFAVTAGPGASAVLVEIPPGAFLQPSAPGEAALVATVGEALEGASAIVDLFAGVGTFTLPLALGGRQRRLIHAVDANRPALTALARAAGGLPASLTTEVRDLVVRPLLPAELDRFDAAVIDPPRAGAALQSEQLARSRVPLVAAVSCNPDSFARDAAVLAAGGYRLTHVVPVDQFLWSAHLELVAIFRR